MIKTFTLRLSLLSIFISLFIFVMISIIFVSTIRYDKAVTKSSFETMEKVSNLILHDLLIATKPPEVVTQLTATLISKNVIDTTNSINKRDLRHKHYHE